MQPSLEHLYQEFFEKQASRHKCRKIRPCNYNAKTKDTIHQIAKTYKKRNSHKNKSISQNYTELETQFQNLAQQQNKNFKNLEI